MLSISRPARHQLPVMPVALMSEPSGVHCFTWAFSCRHCNCEGYYACNNGNDNNSNDNNSNANEIRPFLLYDKNLWFKTAGNIRTLHMNIPDNSTLAEQRDTKTLHFTFTRNTQTTSTLLSSTIIPYVIISRTTARHIGQPQQMSTNG